MNYADVIFSVCSSMKCNVYLELGCQTGNTLRKMIGASKKVIGVDMLNIVKMSDGFVDFHNESTDDFFKHFNTEVDVIFIDADHKFEGVKKDLINSLTVLKKGGVIFIHDSDPEEKRLLHPDFCDDSYRIVDYIQDEMPELDIIALPIDEPGLSIVMRREDRRVKNFV